MSDQLKDVTKPKSIDSFTESLDSFFNMLMNNIKIIVVVCLVIVAGVVGYFVKQRQDLANEKKAQSALFVAEKSYNDKKKVFDESKQTIENFENKLKLSSEKPKDKNAKKPEAPSPDEKKKYEEAKTKLASGDLEKDFGAELAKLSEVAKAHPGTNAGKIASLMVTDLLISHGQYQKAEEILTNIKVSSQDLISGLVKFQKANVAVGLKKYSEAVESYKQILNDEKNKFLHLQVKLNLAQTYEAINDLTKAEELYNSLAIDAENKNSQQVKLAAKYLKQLRLKSKGS